VFNLEHLKTIRHHEIKGVLAWLPAAGATLLEIGAGTGEQAKLLVRAGYQVQAVDLSQSNYADARVFPVQEFDGVNLPFADASFDAIYSSNVLEHVAALTELQAECRRVLRPAGVCVHVLPSTAWRFWTFLSAYLNAIEASGRLLVAVLGVRAGEGPYRRRVLREGFNALAAIRDAVFQSRHGERGNTLTEHWYFSARWWRAAFRRDGFDVLVSEPMGLFYTGYMVAGSRLSLRQRHMLARYLGSACNLFVLMKADGRPSG